MKDSANTNPLLSVRGVSVAFPSRKGPLTAVRDVSFDVHRGQRVAVVGESGSGKSVTASALLRLIPLPGVMTSGQIEFEGRDLAQLSQSEMRGVRGGSIALIAQDPFSSLNPLKTVGWQVKEALSLHTETPKRELEGAVVELLRSVGLRDPERLAPAVPARALRRHDPARLDRDGTGRSPELLIADEPTTALDATTAGRHPRVLIAELGVSRGMAALLITHDLGVVARFAERVHRHVRGRDRRERRPSTSSSAPAPPVHARAAGVGPAASTPGRAPDAIPGAVPALDRAARPAARSTRAAACRGARKRCAEHAAAAAPAGRRPRAGSRLPLRRGADPLPRPSGRRLAPAHQPAPDRPWRPRRTRPPVPTTTRCCASRTSTKKFRVQERLFGAGPGRCRRRRRRASPSAAARCWRSSASPAAGSRRSARSCSGSTTPTAGRVRLRRRRRLRPPGRASKACAARVQVVFQNPGSSLDPRITVGRRVAEPLEVHELGDRAGERAARARSCSSASGCGVGPAGPPPASSSPAGSGSASRSPARSSATRR